MTRKSPSAIDAAGIPLTQTNRTVRKTVQGIELELPGGPAARYRLLWEEAPETCAEVTAALPESAECFHAIFSGTIIGFLLEPTVNAPMENATTAIIPGDLVFAHYDARFRHGHQNPLSEVYWPYDRYARPTIPGLLAAAERSNVFGSFDGSREIWDAFSQRCKRIRFEGTAVAKIRTYR